ncbi:hypothetical protein BJV85_000869 [Clostridium acetobutylicum]|uniref:Conserved membrane protein, possible homolog of CAAX-like membrane endopeptidase n=1 Tax=Clostridium acetobutylicum (strain ATCC 824 / DSM 792 / JCM 1419 / IAM 19013 / LMG 5710 / NBRC 13948 / NRRL B-527 / VKM B-1787 / 2291 / W) TaxID=272562 RepID=Q97ES8_CLOAB|nr:MULTISPECIES: type II CAAX endopeptidase family protein [Clostridium]AAK80969.1 Conserved membrane protein, possible homolog of CAAX-like membrane endopeptidase [Clostridium acetobutylicum ATCC 824]ADZ22071.1 Conserved membrane protein [Clostridium acetobutylicum EA 2018]AEI32656.1 membrane endopeptidase [Clostridium acetobutylicum DSM 1731]AWV78621.1 CPBP family intramembrane metalloprotease [Clostridium acetobutylicum]MBC2393481.1 CPBP family intramembrane metalloprotease [Clostridium ace
MYRLKNKLKTHQVKLFLIMTFLGTYILWGILLSSSKGILNKYIYLNNTYYTFLRILGAAMPSIIGIFLTAYFYGKKEIKKLLQSLTKWKVNILFYIAAVFSLNAQIRIVEFACKLLGMKVEVAMNMQASGFKTSSILGIMTLFLAIVLFWGPLEEKLGWRGFLLPRLQSRFHPVFSAVVIGVIWSLWHLPMFFLPNTGYNSIVEYILVTVILSLEMTWLYNKTGGSLLIAILVHGFDNTYPLILGFSGKQIHKVDLYQVF